VTGEIGALDRPITRTKGVAIEVDADLVAGTVILAMALVTGLTTASHYGMTIDEFNTDDYGPKALAWYISGFTDRSHFETVEFSLWYYGPWFQILTCSGAIIWTRRRGDGSPRDDVPDRRHRARYTAADRALLSQPVGRTSRADTVPDHRLLIWWAVF
jgi:hypothetical protein